MRAVSAPSARRRVVITGMGVVCPLGDSPEQVADAIRGGRTTFMRSDHYAGAVVSPVPGFDAVRYCGRFKFRRYLHKGAALAVSAAVRAFEAAGLDPGAAIEAGLFVGAGPHLDAPADKAGLETGSTALRILRHLPNTAAAVIAQRVGLRGENLTVTTACAASLQAVGEAFRRIGQGALTVALAGGGDSRLSAGALSAYGAAGAIFTGAGDPGAASRPFDDSRGGFVPGEGGAFFVLERLRHALDRGAPILAEVLGYGASLDGYGMTAPDPDGRWARRAMVKALAEAGTTPEDIDAVSAHATGTPLNDAVEAALLERVFERRRPVVMAFKSWLGHLAAACGAVELALVVSALRTGCWPWIRHLTAPCSRRVNFLVHPTPIAPQTVLLQNFGFGGQNAALVVRRWMC